MTVIDRIMERESQMMGRECHLIQGREMTHGVVVVIYSAESIAPICGMTQEQIRVATYVEDRETSSGFRCVSSGIVSTITTATP